MKDLEKVCRQLHLPVQSGSTPILEAMNRSYSSDEYLEKIAFLREMMPDISLSTDVIVGFPGETEEDHQKTVDLLRQVRFTNIFSFRYSSRPLTAASKRNNDVPFEVKRKRLIEIQSIQKKIQLESNRAMIGQVIRILCLGRSKRDPHLYSGRNQGYQVVNFKSVADVIGRFVEVRILSCGPYSLIGETV